MTVPVLPSIASLALSKDVMITFLPGLDLAKVIAASIFGNILPGAKCFSLIYFSASSTDNSLNHCSLSFPKLIATFSTAVKINRVSASTNSASFSEAKSLSITASTPSRCDPQSVTGIPPPPVATTTIC